MSHGRHSTASASNSSPAAHTHLSPVDSMDSGHEQFAEPFMSGSGHD